MEPEAVSVIIPTFNRVALVASAVEQVLAQTYAACHAIVVDDGSTDGTEALIASRFGGEPRVRYVRKPNGGVSSARNVGLAHATGAYVAFLDSDDRWQPWKLALQVEVLRALAPHGVGMVWTNLDWIDPHGAPLRERMLHASYSSYALFERHGLPIFPHAVALAALVPAARDPGRATRVYWGDVYGRMATGNLCQPSTVLLTRERATAAGPFDETMRSGEDHAYHLAVARVGPCALLDVAAVQYTKGNADQLTTRIYKLEIAQNYLRTITPILARERARLALPPAVIRDTLAEAHAWLGQELFERGERGAAREHLARSVRLAPWQPRTWVELAAATAPPQLTARARHAYRMWKRLRAGR